MEVVSKKENSQSAGKWTYLVKTASSVLGALYYLMIVCILLAAIVALILLLVNTPAEQMMLPPFMKLDGDIYSITIGNGIRIDCPYDSVGLGKIKTVIYVQLLMFVCACATVAPISRFLSKIAKKSAKNEHDAQVSRYVTYIGLCVLVGSTLLRLAGNFYNFLLVKTFVTTPDSIHFAFSLPLGGIAIGLIVMALARVYSNACPKTAAVCMEESVVEADNGTAEQNEE